MAYKYIYIYRIWLPIGQGLEAGQGPGEEGRPPAEKPGGGRPPKGLGVYTYRESLHMM